MAAPTPDEWRILSELLDAVLDLPPEFRDAWMSRQAVEHPQLVARPELMVRLTALLAARDSASREGFLDGMAAPPPVSGGRPGVVCGSYVLDALIGRGGMGSVWSARRADGRYDALVAVKLLTAALSDGERVRRFQREGQILARLRHPHIAQLLDAGVTDDGQPFLVLEHIDGQHLDVYAREHAVDVRARVRLFLDVLSAVAHAHANLVVHRDLKPSNILVDATGRVKLLDFGIAKLMRDDDTPLASALTRVGEQVLTPMYASPEQVTGDEVTTATDVYALGVVLFELLTDARPYRLARESRGALEEAIVTGDPVRPSDAAEPARQRVLRGDLDTILLKTLRKDPSERYATVTALADDLSAWLDGRPVRARPDSLGYRTSRFVRRHALAVATAAVVTVAVLGGAGAALWQARVARAEQKRAEQITEYITGIFRQADPYQRTESAISAPELLSQSYNRLASSFEDDSELRFELSWLLGASLASMQQYQTAEPILRDAVAQATALFPATDERSLRARTELAGLLRFRDQLDAMDTLVTEALSTMRAMRSLDGPQLETFVKTLLDSAHLAIDRGQAALAIAPAREADSIAQRLLAADSEQRVGAVQVLVVALEMGGAPIDEVLRATDRAVLATKAHYADEVTHPRVVEGQLALGRALGVADRFDDAIAVLSEADTNSALGSGADNFTRAFIKGALGGVRFRRRQFDAAAADYRSATRILRLHGDSTSSNFAIARGREGNALLEGGRAPEALAPLAHALELLTTAWGAAHPRVQEHAMRLAHAEALSGRASRGWARLAPILADSAALPVDVRGELRRTVEQVRAAVAVPTMPH